MFTRNVAALPLLVLLSVFNCEYNNDKVQSFANVPHNSREINNADNFVNFLNNYNGNEKEISVDDEDRGGNFRATFNDKLKDDYGVIFPYENKGKGWHWVRKGVTDSGVINIKWFGAKGTGLSNYKDDSAAFAKAVARLWTKGGGKLYIPASKSFYGFNGDGLLLPDNTEIYGDGQKSQIKHVNPGSGTYYRGAVFYTTTYGPLNAVSIMREPVYPIQDAEKNQNFITVKNNADISKLKTGELIGLGAGYFLKNQKEEKKARYSNFEVNEITRIEGNKVYLKYPTSVPLKTSSKSNLPNQKVDRTSPVIVDVNGNHTFSDKLKAYDRISRNIYIHDLYLSQADYNMINNTPYPSNVPPPSPIIALGGTFESRYNNLILDSYGTFGGNLFNRCDIGNLTIYSVIKLTDLGYGSANTKMHDVKWVFKQSKIVDTNTTMGFVYLNDGTHDIELSHITATGNWNGKNLFVINGGGHNINIHDVEINLPKLRNSRSTAIIIRDDNEITFSHDITFRNVSISIGGLKQFVEVMGTEQVPDDRKIVFDNVSFNGAVSNPGRAISITNSPAITLSRIKMSQGNIFLDNAASAKIDNLDAPQSDIINRNGKGQKPQVVASKFKQLKNNN
jgi:hypothetical protein